MPAASAINSQQRAFSAVCLCRPGLLQRVGVRIFNLGMDTQTPSGKLMLTVLGAIAQFEREMMLERQGAGIAKAKSEGRYKGRKPI